MNFGKLNSFSFLFLTILILPTLAKGAEWGEVSELRSFVSREDETPILTNARIIDSSSLSAHSLPTLPWSSTFWPDVQGSVAHPYGEFIAYPLDWKNNRQPLWHRGVMYSQLDRLSDKQIENFSPAEKYDLLVGDPQFTFTRQIMRRVDQLQTLDLLSIRSLWSGICHGWSAAVQTFPRPEQVVYMKSPTGRTIPFFPSDIKALAAMSWGDAFGPGGAQNFVKVKGFQCRSGSKRDANERLISEDCNDVNPAFAHLVAVNQIGLNERGFVIDRSDSESVQNQPVFAYKFSYFKVTDSRINTGLDFQSAKVAFAATLLDPFRSHRSPRTRFLIGVEATMSYGMENSPSHDRTDDPSKDRTDSIKFRYDLELDENDEIIGGEWREFEKFGSRYRAKGTGHPDVIWLVPPTVESYSLGDWDIQNISWDGSGPVPSEFIAASVKSANWSSTEMFGRYPVNKLYPQPLLKVVKTLVERSRR